MAAKYLCTLVGVALALVCAPPIRAQTTPTAAGSAPSFEVASVRRDRIRENTSFHVEPNRLSFRNYLMQYIIEWAYGHDWGDFGYTSLRHDQTVGGPEWMRGGEFDYEGYDIDAKVDDALAATYGPDCGPAFFDGRCAYRQQMIAMLRELLADRFKLKVRWETKEGPVYDLEVAKGGPKFAPVSPPLAVGTPPKSQPCPREMTCIHNSSLTMGQLADVLSGIRQLGRPVIDRTALQGGHNINLVFAWEQNQGRVFARSEDGSAGMTNLASDSSGPSIFTALQQQLGLKLKPAKGQVETLEIEHIERPTEN